MGGSAVKRLICLILCLFLVTCPQANASGLPLLGNENRLLLVGPGQSFERIQDAVDAAEDGDTILIFPGIYREAVDVQCKTLTLMGTNRGLCILTHPNGNYLTPPLEMGSGTLMNLTIHATAQDKDANIFAKAYAMHTDYDISENNSFLIRNVDFINEDYQAVGIGLRRNFLLRFENCRFLCDSGYSAFFCHDDPVNQPGPGQRVFIDRCYFRSNGDEPTILLQSQELWGSQITCLWRNNVIVNLDNGPTVQMHLTRSAHVGGGWLGTSYWMLHPISRGNNIPELNP